MKKHTQTGNAVFITLSLLTFAFVFILSLFAMNILSAPKIKNDKVRAFAPSKAVSDPGYTIEETADPFVTKVIKN